MRETHLAYVRDNPSDIAQDGLIFHRLEDLKKVQMGTFKYVG
jgi:hypothetical protein